ncbi:MAG: AAA family ATPase [Spirochaetaceae bacterium]|nr:AAA family ATPase [Spirochaetaceae bacterium]
MSGPPGAEPDADNDDLARQLARPSAWDADAPGVEWIQTHISHVFLVGDRVYKLRKSVRLPFLDFGTRAARNADCLREVALNRRLAPSVYLGVAPIVATEAGPRVGPVGESIEDPGAEHVVVMRRLAAGTDALARLEAGTLAPEHLEAVARQLAHFHASHGLGRPAPFDAAAWRARIARPVLDCSRALADSGLVDATRIDRVEQHIRARLDALAQAFERRRVEGRAVDGHGDLHLDHVWLEDTSAEPLLIDCLEFDDALRRIDTASELAFLAMDLRYRGHPELAESLLSDYAARADDYGLFEVVDFYAAYRALVRAKVAALAAGQTSVPEAQRSAARRSLEGHLGLAERLLEPPAKGALALLCGTVGCGKSSVARTLVRAGRGIAIASDRVRKHLARLPTDARASAAPDTGLYRPEARARVYAAMLERAAPIVASGRVALLDASFTERAERDRARRWAEESGVEVRLFEVRCDPGIALERLRRREAEGRDPSDAGPDFLATSLARYEPPDEWPESTHSIVDTGDAGWAERLIPPAPPAPRR